MTKTDKERQYRAGNEVKIEFIVQRLRQGLSRKDILAQFQLTWQTNVRSFDRLLKEAKKQLRAEYQLAAEKAIVEESEKLKVSVRTSLERQYEIQSAIDMFNEKLRRAKKVSEMVNLAFALVRLHSELSKMRGDYVVKSSQIVNVDVKTSESSVGKYFELVDRRLKEMQSKGVHSDATNVT